MSESFTQEFKEEAVDFFEDFREFFFHVRKHGKKLRRVPINGIVVNVRLAYIFAKRIDSVLKMVFGASILISAITASFVGFTRLSELLDILIFTIIGRILMGIIGLSIFLTASWKLVGFAEVRKKAISEEKKI